MPYASPDPADPRDVWVTATPHELVRFRLSEDLTNSAVRSVHRFDDLPYPGPTAVEEGRIGRAPAGGGRNAWEARRAGGQLYLVRRNLVQVLRVVEEPDRGPDAARLKVAALAQPSRDLLRPDRSHDVFVVSLGGTGLVRTEYPPVAAQLPGISGNHLNSLQSPYGFDYLHLALGKDGPAHPGRHAPPEAREVTAKTHGEVMHIRPVGPEGTHPLRYDLSQPAGDADWPPDTWAREALVGPLPGPVTAEDFGGRYWSGSQAIFAQAGRGKPLYAAIQAHGLSDTEAAYVCMVKFQAGREVWRAGESLGGRQASASGPSRQPGPGKVYAYRAVAGVVAVPVQDCEGRRSGEVEVVVATDFDGGYDGQHPPLGYAWEEHGLWVGNPFRRPDENYAYDWRYIHSSDDLCGAMHPERDGDGNLSSVLYYAGAENEVRLYRIEGWAGWIFQEGDF